MTNNLLNLSLGILHEEKFECGESTRNLIERWEEIRDRFENSLSSNTLSNNQILNSDGELIPGFDDNLIMRRARFKLTGLHDDYRILIEDDSKDFFESSYITKEGRVKIGYSKVDVSSNSVTGFMPYFGTSNPMYKLDALYKKNLNNSLIGGFFVSDMPKIDFLMDYMNYELSEFVSKTKDMKTLLDILEREYNHNIMKYSDRISYSLNLLKEEKTKYQS